MTDIHRRYACLGVLLAMFAASPAQASKHTKKGAVLLRSSIMGAQVKVDGKSLGVTPLKAQALAAGAHTLSLKKAGYQTLVRRVVVREGATEVVQMELVPASGAT
ncbi:MAG TPA: PEGA domain-containing protein, partial [Myxococcota bacterium]|nr:PEGA domain-containing protein [Myxococcota bacterium]